MVPGDLLGCQQLMQGGSCGGKIASSVWAARRQAGGAHQWSAPCAWHCGRNYEGVVSPVVIGVVNRSSAAAIGLTANDTW